MKKTEKLFLNGEIGKIEAIKETPEISEDKIIGTAIICHPHPLHSGTMNNKVVTTLASAFLKSNWKVVRFNFRGVGQSEGTYDEGKGELLDLHKIIEQITEKTDNLALAGFSFGTFVLSQALEKYLDRIQKIVLVGAACGKFKVAKIPENLKEKTLIIHGEIDNTIPLSNVLDWARLQTLPVLVLPNVEHFFHGQLTLLKNLVIKHLSNY